MSSWRPDKGSSEEIEGFYRGHRLKVKRNGQHYHIGDTPYGALEIISVGDLYLVAAENPPEQMSPKELRFVSEEILTHLSKQVPPLMPWKTVSRGSLQEVLQQLGDPGQSQDLALRSLAPFVQPYVSDRPNELCGEARQSRADTLAGLVAAQRPGYPVPALTGPLGVGKHTLAANVAGRLNLRPLEMPLRRMLIQRVLQSPSELLLQVTVALQERVDDGLAIVSEAELLQMLPGPQRHMILRELAQLPHAVLLANQPEFSCENCVPLECPGLMSVEEAGQLIGSVLPDLEVVPEALRLAVSAASDPDFGIIPARLLYVVDIGLSLGRADGASTRFTPDDAVAAVETAQDTWQGPDADVELL